MTNNLHQEYLNALGIQSWLLKTRPDYIYKDDLESEAAIKSSEKPVTLNNIAVQQSSIKDVSMPLLQEIPLVIQDNLLDAKALKKIAACTLCDSRKNHCQVLSGEGIAAADIFFICEAPNADEEREGHYLPGEVQSLFYKMLDVISIKNNYFITGLIKCHSFDNYLVTDEEIKNCSTHLIEQLEEFKPKVIVLLGVTQAQAILKTPKSFNELRNKIHSIEINNKTYQAIVSYHPAYLLRNPLYKKEALKDLILIKNFISQ